MATYSNYYGAGNTAPSGVSINDSRRLFNFGERIAELNPIASPFFTYLSKVSKESTDDPVFKFLEQRHQWQRRNFYLSAVSATASYATKQDGGHTLQASCNYTNTGIITTDETKPEFFVAGQVIALHDSSGVLRHFRVSNVADGASFVTLTVIPLFTADTDFAENTQGQVVGTAWAEGSNDPDGWQDQLSTNEGYCQIFKTAIDTFSNTRLATKHRGISDEYRRVWMEKLMEHKMDIEHTMLFGVGSSDETAAAGPTRYSWGIMPYVNAHGTTASFSYASSGYDDFMDFCQDFFAPESGNSMDKLVLTSRNILNWANKLGSEGFLNNTVTSNSYRLDTQNIKGEFGHMVTKVNTIFGNLHFVQEPLLRNGFEDYAIAVDLKNVKYRPLAGNGISRDTHIITNVQENSLDGRKDIILTEAGLEISLAETHAVLKWN